MTWDFETDPEFQRQLNWIDEIVRTEVEPLDLILAWGYIAASFHMGLADGPTEVHLVTLAKQVLRDHPPAPDLFPSGRLPRLREAAQVR